MTNRKKIILGGILTLVTGGVFYAYNKLKNFEASITISIASFDIDFAQILSKGIIFNVKTNIDNHSTFTPTITGLVVRIYYLSGNVWSLIGTSNPLSKPFEVKNGRVQLQSTIALSTFTLIQSLIGKTLKYKVETTVLTKFTAPIITEEIYTKEINPIAKPISSFSNKITDLFTRAKNNSVPKINLSGVC